MRVRPYHLLLAVFLLLGTLSCGGGGPTPEPTSQLPGTLQTLAVEGQSAPGGGTFGAFPSSVSMDVAEGGFGVFVGDVVGVGSCVFAVHPDGTLLRVFESGETPPGLAGLSAVIDSVLRVWANENGLVLALITIKDSLDYHLGLVTALVGGGLVTNRSGIIYDSEPLTGTGLSGVLVDIDDRMTFLRMTDDVFFGGLTSEGKEFFLRTDAAGASFDLLVATGDPLSAGALQDLAAVGVDRAATRYAFIAEQDDDDPGIGTVGLFGGDVPGLAHILFSQEGDPLYTITGSGPTDFEEDGDIATLPMDQPLQVDGNGTVLFRAKDTPGNDHLVYQARFQPPPAPPARLVGLPFNLAQQGDAAPGAGSLATYGPISWLHNEGPVVPGFRASINLGAFGVTIGLYVVVGPNPGLLIYNGRNAPGGGSLGPTFPGLQSMGNVDLSYDGSTAFVNLLADGSTVGVFWWITGSGGGFFDVARSGDVAPGGHTFDANLGWRQTIADGVMMFRAGLSGGLSGMFRQGP